jgi:hypothetical protein
MKTMSDEYEYFDEAGNRIDRKDLEGMDYEVVDEPAAASHQPPLPDSDPSAPLPAISSIDGGSGTSTSKGRGVIAAVIAVILLVGGGAAYGFSRIGNDNSASEAVEDVKAEVETKTQEAVEDTRPKLDACDGTDIRKAAWGRGKNTPTLQLKVVESVQLPPGFAERTAAADDKVDETTLFQFADRSLGIYDENPKQTVAEGRWWKVNVSTDPTVTVTGEAQGGGRDKNAVTACTSINGGVYRVVGEGIPDTNKEMQQDLVTLSVLKGDGVDKTTVWAVASDRLLKTTLEYTPTSDAVDDGGE